VEGGKEALKECSELEITLGGAGKVTFRVDVAKA